jgi:N-methylhydantoinase A
MLVGIDVGGTFTDLYMPDGPNGAPRVLKVASTPEDPSIGVLAALTAAELSGGEVSALLHGTTIATNALIERRGAKCALITTHGFRDILELGRRDRPHIYGLTGQQNPLIPRHQRWEVYERLDHTGRVLVPLDEQQVHNLADTLVGESLEAVIVALLHSYANPAHEERIRELLLDVNPEWHVVTSNRVLREYYEFERTSTAVVQGYLQPLVDRYARRLGERLSDWGFEPDALVMQSNGGLIPAKRAGELAVNMIRSGPAAGVIAATRIAADAGFSRVITGDMGGTSFDVAISLDGQPREAETTLLDFRVPVRVPMLDVRTIGAGGGSIAWVDRGGILQVGPQSAGSFPGPAAFGRGGTEPTVTDANVVLGRINAEHPIGEDKSSRLDLEAARRAIGQLGAELGLGVEDAALAILAVVNTRMAGEIRLLTLERGHDPRDFVLVMFGGAGPLHGFALMRDIGLGTMLLPRFPGVLCALGCAVADLRHDFSQTIQQWLGTGESDEAVSFDARALKNVFAEQRAQGERELQRDGVDLDGIDVHHHADMAYEGQVHRMRVEVECGWGADELRRAFVADYEREYGTVLPGAAIMLVNARTTVVGRRRQKRAEPLAAGETAPAPRSSRWVRFGGWLDTPVYERDDLSMGAELTGPLIIEQADTTIVVDPGATVRVDEAGNLIVSQA